MKVPGRKTVEAILFVSIKKILVSGFFALSTLAGCVKPSQPISPVDDEKKENPAAVREPSVKAQADTKTRPTSFANYQTRIMELVNLERSRNNLAPLKLSEGLNSAALAHANDMSSQNYFDHRSPQGTTHDSRIRLAMGNQFVGETRENILAGVQTPEETMRMWMNSSGHRVNILARGITHMGAGKAESSRSRFGIYWVQTFASLR